MKRRGGERKRVISGVMWRRKRWYDGAFEIIKKLSLFLYFSISVMYMELVFHIRFFDKITSEIILALLFPVCIAMIPAVICALLPEKISKIMSIVFSVFILILFGVQAVYCQVFKTFFAFSLVSEAGNVGQFHDMIFKAIADQWLTILLLIIPLLYLCIFGRKQLTFGVLRWHIPAVALVATVVLHISLLGIMRLYGTEYYSPYDIYYNDLVPDFAVEKLGVITTMRLDLKKLWFGDGDEDGLGLTIFETTTPEQTSPTETSSTEPTSSTGQGGEDLPVKPIEEILDYVLDTSPNILDIDFMTLAGNEDKKVIKELHTYFANSVPTNKNEYTGMFEGYNLIKLTAEGFSTLALDENVTPTLYKLANSGFVFNNFYNASWWASTTDGEYAACMGLIPKSGFGSFRYTGKNKSSLPFSMGNMLTELGYVTYGYHNNHQFNYYGRDLSHPNMGYIYKGPGYGFDLRKTWPESDLEMIEATLPDYINSVPFHAYYMTISGHANYTFTGNSMASRNKALVADLDYSTEAKAYLACQAELDKAIAKLMDELDKAGLLEKTVIVLSGDHYPYALAKETINELAGHEVEDNFELYKSTLILWSGSMEEPIVIDKPCSAIDIMPTLCNLFGIEYDSRLYIGKDILSDADPIVVFANRSFITDKVMYNTKTKETIMLTDGELPDKYISNMQKVVNNMFKISAAIVENNYYSYIEEFTPYGIDKALYPEKYDFPIYTQ